MPIHFGTDGWRAVISDTFTFHNLRLVAQAISDAVRSASWESKHKPKEGVDKNKIVVGFDTRFLSDRYAVDVSRVFSANGFNVFLAHADSPTPAISYAVKNLGAVGGVMITASHNAPRYNGIKLKASYGGSASPEQCRRVEVYLYDNEDRGRGPNLMDFEQAREVGLITKFNPITDYSSHLRKLIDFDVIADNPPRIVVDSMYGSGRGVIKGMLQGTGTEVKEIRGEMNPGFGGVHPEPISEHLGSLAGAISNHLGDFGLATDGDGDRIGAMDERGNFVDPHKILTLIAKYLIEERGLFGPFAKTISTTLMLDRAAKKYGVEIFETPVGFNHIAEHILDDDVLLGGEESGGISIRGHIPEGDGILIGLLLVEIVSHFKAPLHELVSGILEEFGPVIYQRKDLRLARPVAKAKLIRELSQDPPDQLHGETIKNISTIDGIKYVLNDDSWLLIRPSGTEPVIRVYAEGYDDESVKAMLEFGEDVANRYI